MATKNAIAAVGAESISVEVAGKTFTVDFGSLPAQSQRFIIAYGLKQKLADAGASKEDKVAAAEAMFAKLEAGDLSRAARASSDPVETIMLRLATKAVKAYIRSAKLEVSEDALEAAVSKYMDKNADALRTEAEAEIAAKAEAARKATANASLIADLF